MGRQLLVIFLLPASRRHFTLAMDNTCYATLHNTQPISALLILFWNIMHIKKNKALNGSGGRFEEIKFDNAVYGDLKHTRVFCGILNIQYQNVSIKAKIIPCKIVHSIQTIRETFVNVINWAEFQIYVLYSSFILTKQKKIPAWFTWTNKKIYV